MADISHSELLEVLEYDPERGEFFRRDSRAKRSKNGDVGSVYSNYRFIRIGRWRYSAHRLAWFYITGKWPVGQIDHINCDKLDNRFCNLRVATHAQNLSNQRCRSKSGFKGVVVVSNRYRAGITIGGRWQYLGLYDTPEEAHAAYCARAADAFGEFHRPN